MPLQLLDDAQAAPSAQRHDVCARDDAELGHRGPDDLGDVRR
jgi:hypothetical protein